MSIILKQVFYLTGDSYVAYTYVKFFRASPPWALFFSDPFPNSAFESLFWTFLHVQVTSDPHRGRYFWFENGRAIKYFTRELVVLYSGVQELCTRSSQFIGRPCWLSFWDFWRYRGPSSEYGALSRMPYNCTNAYGEVWRAIDANA